MLMSSKCVNRLGLLVILLFSAAGLRAQEAALNIMSFNIRCGSCEQPTSINHWSQRRALVADLIRKHRPELLGLQEAELFQVRDLAADFVDYGWCGVGRDDGKEKGETTAIFYSKARFVLDDKQTYWLSDTPAVPSKGWDAALPRTATVVTLTDKLTSRQLVMLNAHFDHHGQQARVKSSARVVVQAKLTHVLPVFV
jgi:endonuclease/exonuclease/phosphatase family metal-dependent hydrolase